MVSMIDHQANTEQSVEEKGAVLANPEETAGDNEEKTQQQEEEQKESDVPQGSITEAKSLFQKKDSEGKFQWVVDEPQDAVEAAETKETARFAFLVRKKKSYDSRKKYDIDSIIVQSPWLKKSLGAMLKDYPGVTTNLERLVFKAPFHPFVHRWAILTSLLENDDFEEPVAKEHLQLFHDVIFEELKNAIAAKIDLVKNGVITFDYLWTIFEPQTMVYSISDGKECVFKLNSTQNCTDSRRGMQFLRLDVWSCDWDGTKFGQNHSSLDNYEFQGTTPIINLSAYPLDFHPQKEALIQRLVLRGKLFERYAGYHYMAYRGVCLGYGRCGMIRHNVETRIIIDCDAHNRFMPNYAVYFTSLGRATDSTLLRLGAESHDSDDEDEEVSDSEDYFDDAEDVVSEGAMSNDARKPKHRPLTTEELLLCVPYVRGYAIKTKKWLWFYVDQIAPIKFAENAFSSLVLPSEQKSLIRAFVESQVKYKDDFDDVIAGKGRGM
ncbi:uncharacterized protein A1O9_09680 [Exophiala aquamarina CBS 119918]|uniref:DUF7025 domain-containing protein n=1 Tax=Exophiala aquamarina CBS 119918 TaxID=1182545 RepID=A0A072P5E6_9EURO|nr:uncharacterized protein A1O9_09680 [Exophiala aquamarina CBS 119918]KEF54513.1 hypothetical protein A1O9_09680 [Exophiala aquamarina CBS 119918]